MKASVSESRVEQDDVPHSEDLIPAHGVTEKAATALSSQAVNTEDAAEDLIAAHVAGKNQGSARSGDGAHVEKADRPSDLQESVSGAEKKVSAKKAVEATSVPQPNAVPEAAPPTAAKARNPIPVGLGMAWMQRQDRAPTSKKVYLGAGIFVGVFCLILIAQWWQPHLAVPKLVPDFSAGFVDEELRRSSNIFEEMEKAAASQQASLPKTENSDGEAIQTSTPGNSPSRAKNARAKGAARTTQVAAVQPPDPVTLEYERMYGPAHRMQAASVKSRKARDSAASKHAAPSKSGDRGLFLQAFLTTTAASSPTNSPVVAKLSRRARLGDKLLPVDTEFHGEVRGGGSGARVFVDFLYARFADGTTLDLDAVAADLSGLVGIPGIRPITGRTAGSIGLAGGQAGIRAGAGLVPGPLGIAASGAAAMADASANATQRLDRDDVVIQANANTPIMIYIKSVRPL